MLARLLALFIIIPIIELVLLLRLGEWLSFWPTVGIIVATGILGAWLTKRQGRRTIFLINQKARRGEIPGDDLIDGVLILIAGALLVTPGVLTDVAGLSLLTPFVRGRFRGVVKRRFKGRIQAFSAEGLGGATWARSDGVIDVTPEPEDQEIPERERISG